LTKALKTRSAETVEALLEGGAAERAELEERRSLLLQAVGHGSTDGARVLLRNGFDISGVRWFGCLSSAAQTFRNGMQRGRRR
jgi:hypothetical protein